jgi:hypothetical protein
MNNFFLKQRFSILLAATTLTLGITANAEEGGTGHYAIGGVATMADLAPTDPGWIIQPLYLNYEGDAANAKVIPTAGKVTLDLDAKVDALVLGAIYTFDEPVLGAYYSVATYLPYVEMDVTAKVLTDLSFQRENDNVSGLGDITLVPVMLAWKSDNWQYSAMLPIYAPTGDYEVGRLANQGLNYWTVDPTIGASYNNPDTGFNFALNGGITFNTENNDTDYKSGSVIHVETSVQQLLPLGPGFVGVGLNAFIYQQISSDNGEGAVLGDFKGRSMGIGPVLTYILPTKAGNGLLELRWLPETNTEKRLEGDYFWLKAAWQF